MSESAEGLLLALQQKASAGLEALTQAVREYETWLAQATAQARQTLRSHPSAQAGSRNSVAVNSEKENTVQQGSAHPGKRRRKAAPLLETVAEEGAAEHINEDEGQERAEPEVEDTRPPARQRRQPGRRAKAKQAAEAPAPAATGQRRTRAQARAAACESSEGHSGAPADAAATENDSEQSNPAQVAQTTSQPEPAAALTDKRQGGGDETAAASHADIDSVGLSATPASNRRHSRAQQISSQAERLTAEQDSSPLQAARAAQPAQHCAKPALSLLSPPGEVIELQVSAEKQADLPAHQPEDEQPEQDDSRQHPEAAPDATAAARQSATMQAPDHEDESIVISFNDAAGLATDPSAPDSAAESVQQPAEQNEQLQTVLSSPILHHEQDTAPQAAEDVRMKKISASPVSSTHSDVVMQDNERRDDDREASRSPGLALQLSSPEHPSRDAQQQPSGGMEQQPQHSQQEHAAQLQPAGQALHRPDDDQPEKDDHISEQADDQPEPVSNQTAPAENEADLAQDQQIEHAKPEAEDCEDRLDQEQQAEPFSEGEEGSDAEMEASPEHSHAPLAEAQAEGDGGKKVAKGGFNVVSAIRSFLPMAAAKPDGPPPRKNVKVKALEAAVAARQKERERVEERARQKQALEHQKADRARHVQEAKARQEREQKRKAEQAKMAMQKREEEAAAARKAREETERRERREKQQRQEEARQQKRQQELRAEAEAALRKQAQAEEERKRKAQAAIARELEAKRARPAPPAMAPAQPAPVPVLSARDQPAPLHGAGQPMRPAFPVPAAAVAAQAARVGAGAALPPSRLQQASFAFDPPPPQPTPAQARAQAAQPKSTQRKTPAAQRVAEEPGYDISPYRGDTDESEEEEEEEEEPQQKRIPAWARGQELQRQLHAQLLIDPDQIFQQRQRTCALDDVFAAPVKPKPGKRDLKERRTSTSNWIEDRVTWQEEKLYKKAMGYMK